MVSIFKACQKFGLEFCLESLNNIVYMRLQSYVESICIERLSHIHNYDENNNNNNNGHCFWSYFRHNHIKLGPSINQIDTETLQERIRYINSLIISQQIYTYNNRNPLNVDDIGVFLHKELLKWMPYLHCI